MGDSGIDSVHQSGVHQFPQQPNVQSPHEISHSASINTLPSLHPDYIISGDILGGQIINGRMSSVRRSFCLLVTFDFLFAAFLWLICILSTGENIMKGLNDQVYHYNVHTSLFDVVMCAACRFVVLLLFYALLYINHWFVIALSTASTCAFLIGKVFVYDWSANNHPTFEVPLVLFSFVVSWAEAWFLDSRVLPQEYNARNLFIPSADLERAPLIRSYVTGLPSTCTESVANFYSPLGSPEGSLYGYPTGEAIKYAQVNFSQTQKEQYKKKGAAVLERAVELANNPKWEEKFTEGEDSVHVLMHPKIGKVYKYKTSIDISPKCLLEELFNKVESITDWNPTLLVSDKVQALDEHTDITYQVSAPAVGGQVKSRDFVTLRHWDRKLDTFVLAWEPTEHPAVPKCKDKCVRGENVIGCFIIKPKNDNPNMCDLQWMLNIKLNLAWVPKVLMEPAITDMMSSYITHLKRHVGHLKSNTRAI